VEVQGIAADPSDATTSLLDVVKEWGRAVDELDEEALIALADREIELVTSRGTRRGHDALRTWLAKQTYGVIPRFETRRAFVAKDTVVVDVRVEFRFLDGGEVAGSEDAAVVFAIRDGLVRRIAPHPNLASALSVAGLDEADEAPI